MYQKLATSNFNVIRIYLFYFLLNYQSRTSSGNRHMRQGGEGSCLEENVLHNFPLPGIIRDLFLWLKALYLIEVPVLLGKVKHRVLCYLYHCGSELIRFASKNKTECRKQSAEAPGGSAGREGEAPPRARRPADRGGEALITPLYLQGTCAVLNDLYKKRYEPWPVW